MSRKITIDIEVNGKMQKATVDAKKLSAQLQGIDDGLGSVSKSARTTDRNIKGTANASSNASKNFSKMQQGMGGLVGAYASLAASLFAVSAAFNFLKSAGELKSLRAGQIAYASATGAALRTLTNDIIEATNAQISFRDAAQAAAIGTAAGLTADQLTRLGKAAADVSQILGRDVTDSFNRLVRGVTKAEPELLDELGIILRLEDAATKYADALGLNANELNTFQRQQAVTNFVLDSATTKYSDILDIIGRSPNQYAQLGKAFDDIVMSIKDVVDMVAGPLAKVLQETPALAIASLGVLLSGPLRALGFSFAGIAEAAKDAAVKQQVFFQGVRADAILARKEAKDFKRDLKGLAVAGMGMGAKAGFLTSLAGGQTLSGQEEARFKSALSAAENNVNRLGIVTKGAFTGMKIHMVREMNEAFMNMNLNMERTLGKGQVFALRMKSHIAGIGAVVKSVAAGIAGAFSRALSLISYGALAFTGYQMYQEFNKAPLTDEEAKLQAQAEAADNFRRRLKSLNEEYAQFAEIQGKLAAKADVGAKVFNNLAQFLSATGEGGMGQTLRGINEGAGVTLDANAAERNFSKNAVIAGGVLGTAIFGKKFAEAGREKLGPTLGKVAVKAATSIAARTGFTAAGAAFGTALLPGIGTALGAGLGFLAAGVASYFVADKFLPDQIDNVRRAGFLPDDITGGDTQERLAKKTLSDEGTKRLEQIRDTLETTRKTTGLTTVAMNALLARTDQVLRSEGPISDEQVANLEKAREQVIKMSQDLGAADKAINQGKTSFRSYINEAAKLTSSENLLNDLTLARDALQTKIDTFIVLNDEGKEKKDQMLEELAILDQQKEMAVSVAQIERDKRAIAIEAQEHILRLMGDETKEEKDRIQFHNDMVNLTKERRLIEAEITALQQQRAVSGFEAGSIQDKGMASNLALLQRSLDIIFNRITDRVGQYEVTRTQTDVESLKNQGKILDIAKQVTDQEKKRLGFAQQILDLQKNRDSRGIERSLMEERLRNPFYFINEDEKRAKLELEAFNRRYDQEESLIIARGEQAKIAIAAEYAVLRHRLDVIKAEGLAKGTIVEDDEQFGALSNLRKELSGTERLAQQAAAAGTLDELEALEHKKFMLESQIELTNQFRVAIEEASMSLTDNLTNALAGLIDGSASAKDAFKALANSMIQDISRIIARLLVQQAIMASMNMLSSAFPSLFGGGPRFADGTRMAAMQTPTGIPFGPAGRYGGILDGMRYGGMTKKKYSMGGVARGSDAGYLAMLHGTEAVVPLPNGRSIPVQLSGAGAQTNNVSVNVNVNNDGTAETTTEDDARGMGKAIAAAVQREIQHQKRPGGMLSPYGGTR